MVSRLKCIFVAFRKSWWKRESLSFRLWTRINESYLVLWDAKTLMQHCCRLAGEEMRRDFVFSARNELFDNGIAQDYTGGVTHPHKTPEWVFV